jgi:phosphoribosyl-dephospho-CoA transferase
MILRPHDLLRLSDLAGLLDASDWVRSTFSRTPWVVVRRGDAPAGRVAAGVRGDDRSHRYALTVSEGQIGDVVTPEDLGAVDLAAARDLPRAARARRCAKVPRGARDALGPTGSVGFELATGAATVTRHSALDLVVRADASRRLFRNGLRN